MTIRYEANPPKILPDIDLEKSISKFIDRIKTISANCDAIHLTENVLGHKRVSPVDIGIKIKKELPELPITISLRVRDKNENEITNVVNNSIKAEFNGILVLMGDPSQSGQKESGLIPSAVVKKLRNDGVDSKIDLYLSISNNPNFSKIGKKLDAKPRGFMTQVVQTTEQVQNLVSNLKDYTVIPIVLFPSEKNQKSADFLGLNMSEYKESFPEFVKQVHQIAGDILITSPNDFTGLNDFLKD